MSRSSLSLLLMLVPLSAGALPPSPDYLWRRAALTQPRLSSSNGDGLVTVEALGECYLLRASDGMLTRSFTIDSQACVEAVPSPRSRYVAVTTLLRGTAYAQHVYETQNWIEVFGGGGSLYFAKPAFSSDDRFLIVGSRQQVIYETGTWRPAVTLEAHGSPSISPNSSLVALFEGVYDASQPWETPVHLFRVDDGADVTPASGYPATNLYLLANDWIALGLGDEIQIQSLSEPPQLIATLAAPNAGSLTLTPDGTLLAAVLHRSGDEAQLQIWETANFSTVASWPISSGPATSARAAFAFNDAIASTSYLTSSAGARIDLWDARDGGLLRPMNVEAPIFTPLLFTPDGAMVIGAFGSAGTLRLWDAIDGSSLGTVEGAGSVTSLAFSNSGDYLVGGGARLNVWSWPEGELRQSLSDSARQIAISSAGVVAQRTDNEIRLRSLPDLELLRVIPQSGSMAFSPDGNFIQIGPDLFEVASGTLVRTFQATQVQDAIFSLDGSNVLLSAQRMGGQEVERFDVASGDLVSQFGWIPSSFFASLGSFTFSPDGSRLAEVDVSATPGSEDERLRIWDGFGGLYQDYSADIGFGGGWARYSPDGRFLALALGGMFGVALDPCAEATCVPNCVPGR